MKRNTGHNVGDHVLLSELENWQEQSLQVLHTYTYVTDPNYKIIIEKAKKWWQHWDRRLLMKATINHLDLEADLLFYMLCFHPCQNKREAINSS